MRLWFSGPRMFGGLVRPGISFNPRRGGTRIWIGGPRILNGLVRPGISFGPSDFRRGENGTGAMVAAGMLLAVLVLGALISAVLR